MSFDYICLDFSIHFDDFASRGCGAAAHCVPFSAGFFIHLGLRYLYCFTQPVSVECFIIGLLQLELTVVTFWAIFLLGHVSEPCSLNANVVLTTEFLFLLEFL